MNLQAQGMLKNENQTPLWCECQIVTSDVWQLTGAQRMTYKC